MPSPQRDSFARKHSEHGQHQLAGYRIGQAVSGQRPTAAGWLLVERRASRWRRILPAPQKAAQLQQIDPE